MGPALISINYFNKYHHLIQRVYSQTLYLLPNLSEQHRHNDWPAFAQTWNVMIYFKLTIFGQLTILMLLLT